MADVAERAPATTPTLAPRRSPGRDDRAALAIGAALLLGFFALVPTIPFTSGDTFFWNEVLIFVLFASSLNLLTGYAGMISFGHAAYYGAGVYAVAVMVVEWDRNMMLVNLAFGTLVGAVLAAVVGALIVRTAGLSFAILTLAFGQLAFTFVYQQEYFGGEDGMAGVVRSTIGPLDLQPPENFYYFTLAIVVLAMALIWVIVNSPLGLTMKSIREDAGRTQYLGLRVRFYKLAVFTLAGALAGLAGSLRSYQNLFATTEELDLVRSAEPIIMTILGGLGTFLGPAIGAIGYLWLEDWLQSVTDWWILYVGLGLVALIVVLPGGLLGGLTAARQWVNGKRSKR